MPSQGELLALILTSPRQDGYVHISDGWDWSDSDEGKPRLAITLDLTVVLPEEWHEWARGYLTELDLLPTEEE